MKVANSILASVAVLAVVDAEGLRVSFSWQREVDLSMTIGAYVGLWFMPTDGWYSTHPYTVCIDGSLSYAAYWGCMDGERRFNLVVVAPRHS